jgi:hypothetical protein
MRSKKTTTGSDRALRICGHLPEAGRRARTDRPARGRWCNDRNLAAELVRRVGLALADALGLGGHGGNRASNRAGAAAGSGSGRHVPTEGQMPSRCPDGRRSCGRCHENRPHAQNRLSINALAVIHGRLFKKSLSMRLAEAFSGKMESDLP